MFALAHLFEGSRAGQDCGRCSQKEIPQDECLPDHAPLRGSSLAWCVRYKRGQANSNAASRWPCLDPKRSSSSSPGGIPLKRGIIVDMYQV